MARGILLFKHVVVMCAVVSFLHGAWAWDFKFICINEPTREKTNNLHMRSAKLISAIVFATQIAQYLFFLTLKFQASSHLL